jgi:hypothetical protein
MDPGAVIRDAWQVYLLLFRRSVIVAGVVYLAIAALEVTNGTAAAVLSQLAGIGGPVLVQGALVLIVRNVHEGERPAEIVDLGRRAGRRFLSLLGASILYAVGVAAGLLLLIYPGLLAASRWCLMAPGIMLEGRGMADALGRSRALVRGEDTQLGNQTWNVLVVLIVTFVFTAVIPGILTSFLILGFKGQSHASIVVGALIGTFTAPYQAHVLSVLYYRLTDPDRPAIDPAVRAWPSVWKGPA